MTEPEIISQAVQAFLAAGHEVGDCVPHAQIRDYLRCKDPMENGILADEGQRRSLIYMQRFGSMREALLVGHKIALVSDHGAGYRWLKPEEQTSFAVESGLRQAQKALRKSAAMIEHVDTSKLSNMQAATRANSAAHVSSLQGILKQPPPKFW